MTAPLPKLSPQMSEKVDRFYMSTCEMLDRYIGAFEVDMNRHAVKHGPMPEERAVYDMAKILARDLTPEMLAGITAAAIVRGIAKKRQGKG